MRFIGCRPLSTHPPFPAFRLPLLVSRFPLLAFSCLEKRTVPFSRHAKACVADYAAYRSTRPRIRRMNKCATPFLLHFPARRAAKSRSRMRKRARSTKPAGVCPGRVFRRREEEVRDPGFDALRPPFCSEIEVAHFFMRRKRPRAPPPSPAAKQAACLHAANPEPRTRRVESRVNAEEARGRGRGRFR